MESEPVCVEELTARCMGKIELVERILGCFHDSIETEMDRLEAAVRAADATSIEAQAHRIKGSCRTVSAKGLEQFAERLENAAGTGDTRAVADLLGEMQSECERVKELISQRNAEVVG